MEPKANYVVVGAFVVILGIVAIGVVLWLGKSDYRGAYDRYYAYMQQSVSGLSVNSTVKYLGVDVGRVKEIALNPDNMEEVRLTLDILKGTPIKTDTVATLETQGLTGLAIVNLVGGSREAPRLEAQPGQPYPVIQTKPSLFYRLDMAISRLLSEEGFTKLLTQLTTLSEQASALLNEHTRQQVDDILQDLSSLLHVLGEQRHTIHQGIENGAEAMENLAILTATVNRELPDILNRIRESAVALQHMSGKLAQTGETVNAIVQEHRPNLEQFMGETLHDTSRLIADLRQLTATLQRVARQIEREPESLMFGRPAQPRGPGE